MAGKKGCGGKKGRSGRKSKSFEFEVARLKELSLRRAIRVLEEEELEDEKENNRLVKRQDEITLKVLDKAIPSKTELAGEDGGPIRLVIRASADKAES